MGMQMKTSLKIIMFFYCFNLFVADCFSGEPWKFQKSYESNQLIENPFSLMTAADINKNGFKELIVTDFGKFGDHIDEWKEWRKDWNHYNLFVFEWDKGKLKTTWNKQWDMTKMKTDIEAHRYFLAFEARQMVPWQIGDRVMVETIPPYLGLEWLNGKYVLHEQQGPFNSGPLVGSWVFPWLSPSCYPSFSDIHEWSRECLVGIRNFAGVGDPQIVTIVEGEIIKDKHYMQNLRVRRFDTAFTVVWEEKGLNKRFVLTDPIDKLNLVSKGGLLLREFRTAKWYLLNLDDKKNNYHLQEITTEGIRDLELYDLPDLYLRTTQKKGSEEYWGYHFAKVADGGNILLLRKVVLKSDLTGFNKEDIDFDHHKSFLGVGFFDLKDLDGDGLDEVILVEETGKREFGEETIYYSDVKDYIRILKWDGKEYKTMWVSPPYTKRGTKFLVEDIKNTGKKQLIVMTSNGTIQIWERH